MGRRAKPLALAIVESGGKAPRKSQRERAARAPQAIVGLPEPPAYLTDGQRGLWLDLVAVSPGGLFCKVDAAAFETYVVLLDAQRQCLQTLNTEHAGAPIKATGNGPRRTHMTHAALKEYKHLAAMLRTWQNDFGFNPVARLRVQTVPEPPKGKPVDARQADPLLRFLGNAA